MINQSLDLQTQAPRSKPIAVAVIGKCQYLLKGLLPDTGLVCAGSWRNGNDAITGLEKDPPQVILMDIDCPSVGGIVATSRIKLRFAGVQILAVTSSHDARTIVAAIQRGASGHVHRSATPGDVARAVQKVMHGGVTVSEEVARGLISNFHKLLGVGMSPADLTHREHEVMTCICRGRSNKEVASELEITAWTVNVHLRNIYRKLSVHCRTEAAMKFRDLILHPACPSKTLSRISND